MVKFTIFLKLIQLATKSLKSRAVVVAQLVERSLPTPEVQGLIPVIGKNI